MTRRTFASLRTSEIHSKTENMKWRIFDDIILKKLGDSVAKSTNFDASEHTTYSDGIDPDYVKLPEDDDTAMPDGAATFEKPIMNQ